jgi:hypothetical protein
MTRDMDCTIDKAARTAILLVDGRISDSKGAEWTAARAEKVVLFDASALVSILSETLADTFRASTRHHFRMFLDRVMVDDRHSEHWHETLRHFLDDRAHAQLVPTRFFLGDATQSQPHCDAEPIDRALVWGETELGRTIGLWSALDRHPVRGNTKRCRYLFLAQAGAEDDRRGYIILVQSAARSDHELNRLWLEARAPAVLKFKPQVYCQGSFATRAEVRPERASRELLMCVVPLDPVEPDEDVDADFAMDRLAGLLCNRLEPVADHAEDEAPGAPGSHEAWLSLKGYADMFLGDGERRCLLEKHLGKRRDPGGKGQADPGLT